MCSSAMDSMSVSRCFSLLYVEDKFESDFESIGRRSIWLVQVMHGLVSNAAIIKETSVALGNSMLDTVELIRRRVSRILEKYL